jgi:hypothetical protein
MELEHVTFIGPPIDDGEILVDLPVELTGMLRQVNGFIQYHGGLHVRGACREPAWHSLRDAWVGPNAFHRLYPEVRPADIPFAEDCLGDQFLLRDGVVHRLWTETGELEALGVDFKAFFRSVQADPIALLSFEPLLRFQQEGGTLEPGQLLAAFPPYCTEEAAEGLDLAAISAGDRRRFLAYFAAQIRDVPEGGRIGIQFVE